ncbi:MAG: uroporphyrinogen decarboxylase [Oscillospiraceae bacterium]|nr:uroporphyrinogen decarboxylase [Oscillospiraceae bacterium]
MEDMNLLREERAQLFRDIYSGKKPKRVPVQQSPAFEATIQYAIDAGVTPPGKTRREVFWEPDLWFDIVDYINSQIYSDTAIGVGAIRLPILYQSLGARCIIMSESGVMQHPEVHCLEPEEYDAYIADPMTYQIEVLLPRLYTELDTTPGRRAMVMAKAMKANADHMAKIGGMMRQISQKYGYPGMASGRSTAPFDYIADFLRGFSRINTDMRRCPDKLLEACDAIIPMMIRESLGSDPKKLPPNHRTFIPLHMGSFISTKQFERFWYPSMKKVMDGLVAYGHGVDLFVEDDWMRHMEAMNEFTGSIRYQFEKGDPVYVKKLFTEQTPPGSVHIITGFYQSDMLRYNTKEECIDAAKKLFDIVAADGGYVFNFDKGLFSLAEPVASNLKALSEWIRDNAVY